MHNYSYLFVNYAFRINKIHVFEYGVKFTDTFLERFGIYFMSKPINILPLSLSYRPRICFLSVSYI